MQIRIGKRHIGLTRQTVHLTGNTDRISRQKKYFFVIAYFYFIQSGHPGMIVKYYHISLFISNASLYRISTDFHSVLDCTFIQY